MTVVEYGDYECPYCAALAPVLRELVDGSDGRVNLVFRNYPEGRPRLHRLGHPPVPAPMTRAVRFMRSTLAPPS